MNTKKIFIKTMPFLMIKLAVGLMIIALSSVFGVCVIDKVMHKVNHLESLFVAALMGLVFAMVGIVWRYLWYSISVGHIAVVSSIIATGDVPHNQIKYGKGKVMEKFASLDDYMNAESLIGASVLEIQDDIDKRSCKNGIVYAMTYILRLVYSVYSDMCCLGWSFYKNDKNKFKGLADGIAIYYQNDKNTVKECFKTVLKVLTATSLIFVGLYVVTCNLFLRLDIDLLVATLISMTVAVTFKIVVLDSYVMIDSLNKYIGHATDCKVENNTYRDLSRTSKSFKKLVDKSGLDFVA